MLKDKNLYCVGGYIRDEILGIKNFDIDYCYQGNTRISKFSEAQLEILPSPMERE